MLRKDLDTIADELAIYYGIDCSEKEIADTLKLLQDFDPAGIGARSLQECLLLQIERKVTDGEWERNSSVYNHLKLFSPTISMHLQRSIGTKYKLHSRYLTTK